MSAVVIRKVSTKQEMNDFVKFPETLYAGCTEYVPDMETEVRETFDPNKNAGLEFSTIQSFVAYKDGIVVGRIAGIINRRANETWKTKNVRFGFFDFIDDQEVSSALLDTVVKWGKEQGMEQIIGPMGITDFDKEGMLVEDFDKISSISTYYNYAYYPQHMEKLGYEKEVDWVQIRVAVPEQTPPRYVRVSKLAKDMLGLHVRILTDKEIKNGYGRKIFNLLNEAYSPLFGFSALSPKQIDAYVKKYITVVDKKLMPVIENEKGELIGTAVTMSSISNAMRKSKGRLFPLGWFHLLRAIKWKREDTVEMLLIAVRPDCQGMGVNAIFFDHLIPVYNQYKFKWAETGPQLEDNVRELSQWKVLNPTFVKRRRCYKKKI